MYPQRQTVAAPVNGSGDATVYSAPIWGSLHSIQYVKANYSNGVDFTITNETTGESLWAGTDVNAATIVYPRVAVHDTAGTAATLDGTRAMRDRHALAGDRVKIVVASGGASTSGSFNIVTM